MCTLPLAHYTNVISLLEYLEGSMVNMLEAGSVTLYEWSLLKEICFSFNHVS